MAMLFLVGLFWGFIVFCFCCCVACVLFIVEDYCFYSYFEKNGLVYFCLYQWIMFFFALEFAVANLFFFIVNLF